MYSKNSKPFVTCVAEDNFKICGEDCAIRRVFIHCSDSGAYFHVGWMLIQDVHKCLVCCGEFGNYLHCTKRLCSQNSMIVL